MTRRRMRFIHMTDPCTHTYTHTHTHTHNLFCMTQELFVDLGCFEKICECLTLVKEEASQVRGGHTTIHIRIASHVPKSFEVNIISSFSACIIESCE